MVISVNYLVKVLIFHQDINDFNFYIIVK